MKLKKSFRVYIRSLILSSEVVTLILLFAFLYSHLSQKEKNIFKNGLEAKTQRINSYIESRIESEKVLNLFEDEKTITYRLNENSKNERIKNQFDINNSGTFNKMFHVTNYFSSISSGYYPPISEELKNQLFSHLQEGKRKSKVILLNGELTVLTQVKKGNNVILSTYIISLDIIFNKVLLSNKIEGFYGAVGSNTIGWIGDKPVPKKFDIDIVETYKLGLNSKLVAVTNNLGIDGLYYIISDSKNVSRNNNLIIFLGILFLVKFLSTLLVCFFVSGKFTQYLDTLVNDTKVLAIKGNNTIVKRKDYIYSEFQSLIKAFLKVIEMRDNSEEKLIESKKEVESIVIQRTKELTLALQRAEETSRSKMNFLASVAHEIRTPMNCIIGFCELVLDDMSEVNTKEYAIRIIDESETLLHLINDILDNSKIESGKMELSENEVHLPSFIKSITSLGNPYDIAKNVEISYTLKDDVPTYIGIDEVRLYQVISNIYFNALKFTSSGNVSINVSFKKEINSNYDLISFKIIDTGIGIPKDRILSVFEQYKQLDDGLTREYRGSGLGLSITKKIVELMNGKISVQSELGVGSCFTVEIPAKKIKQNYELKVEIATPINKNRSAAVLIVEDYPTNRIIAKKHLESIGYSVTEVENGKDAVDICNKHYFDLILMDIQMPLMDGFKATETIKESSLLNSNTPILAMTANGLQSIKERCIKVGMSNIILKPIRKHSFLESVQRALDEVVIV